MIRGLAFFSPATTTADAAASYSYFYSYSYSSSSSVASDDSGAFVATAAVFSFL